MRNTVIERAACALLLLTAGWLGACASENYSLYANEHAEDPASLTRLMPAGVNQPCRSSTGQESQPSRSSPATDALTVPVILVHGTFANANRAFKTLAPRLKENGFCPFAINYGKRSNLPSVYATGDMQASADEIKAFIESVLKQTGASQVDLVGHSQGGTLALYLAKQEALRTIIRRVVAVSPSTRGTLTSRLLSDNAICTACKQQSADSPFIRSLHAGPVNPAGIPTLVMSTDNDRVVIPVQSQFVFEPNVTNIRLQELVPGRYATHSGILHDSDAVSYIVGWLKSPD